MYLTDVFILVGLGILLAFYFGRQRLTRSRSRARIARAGRREAKAMDLLAEKGYTILDVNREIPVLVTIDGKTSRIKLVGDLVAAKDGKVFLVQFRRGKLEGRLTAPVLRRQLLEYFLAFRPDGILLLDVESGRLRRVNFEIPSPWPALALKGRDFFAAAALGGGLVWWLLKRGG